MIGRFVVQIRKHRMIFLISLLIVVVLLFTLWAAREAGKTIFDVIEILIIPAVLGVGALLFQMAERRADRYNTIERQRQETLLTYYDRMSDLLLNRNKELRDAAKGSEVRTVAQARTVAALQSLNGHRIAQLIQFLTKSNLGGDTLLTLNLSQADLQGVDLRRADLRGADLSGANLQAADLRQANLQLVDLSGANLQLANLSGANLLAANLIKSNLQGASLWESNLYMAHLIEANLQTASLLGANLKAADLTDAKLQGTYLHETFNQATNLTDAKVTFDQISSVASITGAKMPNGSKYEVWVARGKPDWVKKRVSKK